ncbi:MAG: hypothetical protein NTY57_04265 [Solirubrobacterales bacterium]|nr:hypothetical protein [Solirubrobacterales bacterium]
MLVTLNFAAVLFMAGVGWLVQLVAYPLYAFVGRDDFVAFHTEWSRRITTIVLIPMTIDLVTSIWLALTPPSGVSQALAVGGAVLAGLTWLSTALLQVPRHEKLSGGFDEGTHASLVATSWVRTIGWSAHAVICVLMISAMQT